MSTKSRMNHWQSAAEPTLIREVIHVYLMGSSLARLGASQDQGRTGGGGFGETKVPKPLSPRSRSRVGE